MKKSLSLILAAIMLLGCMSIPAFADNVTTVTATVPDTALTYDIIIPTCGAALTAENHANGVLLGSVQDGETRATVENVKNANNSKVYYTATLGDFTDGSGNTMTASYTYAQGGDYAALTDETKVTVFDGSKSGEAQYADSTVKVSVSDEVWNAAVAGTYTATVTFNFAEEEVAALPATMTIADILATAESALPSTQNSSEIPAGAWKSGENSCFMEPVELKGGKLDFYDASSSVYTNIKPLTDEAQLTEGNYVYTYDTKTCTFTMQNGKLTAIIFSCSDGTGFNGTYTAPTVG